MCAVHRKRNRNVVLFGNDKDIAIGVKNSKIKQDVEKLQK